MVYCRRCRSEQQGCCAGGRHRRKRSRIDGVDRISALHDDLLLHILTRLDCVRAAAHTSLLARRWRGLWTLLPELAFHHIARDEIDAALAMSARPSLSLLHIRNLCWHHNVLTESARVSAWMRAAARLATARIVITDVTLCGSSGLDVELPCFDRAISITLEVFGARFVLPQEGDLPALESLSLRWCDVDLEDLLPRCSRLRKLQIFAEAWEFESLKVHSPTLEELDVQFHRAYVKVRCFDIVTPKLKKLRIAACLGAADGFTLSHYMPLAKKVHWECSVSSATDRFGVRWFLFRLTLKSAKNTRGRGNNHLHQRRRRPGIVHTLSLSICYHYSIEFIKEDKDFGRQISQIPVTKFQILELLIDTGGHVYGPMVLYLLVMCSFIQRLTLKLCKVSGECPVNCPCDKPDNWRGQNISLVRLKEVRIHGFKGQGHEVDLLKAIFRGATMLKRMTVYLSNTISPSNSGFMDIISKAYPSVKFNIYHEPSS